MRTHNILLSVTTAFLLAACASAPPPPPDYNPDASAESQASQFIAADKNAKQVASIKKLAVTACNVMFANTSSASASTGGGIFSEAGGNKRAEAKVSVYYTLVGLSDKDMQRMTDEICANAESQLKASGFELVSRDALKKNASMIALQKAGKTSPFEYKSVVKGNKSVYKVFAQSGSTVADTRYIGTASGLGQAFKAAKGTSAIQYEARVMDELGVDAVNINILVDFAQLTSSGQGAAAGGLADRNTAEVKSTVGLSVSGQMQVKVAEGMKCWVRFGNRECGIDPAKQATFNSKRAVTIKEKFYKSVDDATTTGDAIASGLTKGLAMLAGGTSSDVTRYNVVVDPKTFDKVSRKSISGFTGMAAVSLKAAKAEAK